MSEKSFAVASVSVAIIWGTFFYPPTPHVAQTGTPAAAAPAEPVAVVTRAPGPLVMLKTAGSTPAAQANPSHSRCAIARINGMDNCAPLHELAGD
jgi:hypothetical protein